MGADGLPELPASARAPGLARAHVRRLLELWELGRLGDEVLLLTTSATPGPRPRPRCCDRRPAGADPAAPAHIVELTQGPGVQYAGARARPGAVVDAALDRGDDTVDLVYEVPAEAAAAATVLDALMAEADELCRAEALPTVPRDEVIADFASWYRRELVEQCAGGAATPWRGPVDPD